MYSKKVERIKRFDCEHFEFTIEHGSLDYNIDDIYSICRFIDDSQEEICSSNDYTFNGISIVGCDLIDYLRRF